MGVIPRASRSAAGYRLFPSQAERRLQVVRAAQQFGFSLRDIAGFFSVRDDGGKPCERVREAAERMLIALDTEIDTLQAKRRRVRRTLRQWNVVLARTAAHDRAFLLESLTTRNV